jgi:DNA polymerase III alpha subunit
MLNLKNKTGYSFRVAFGQLEDVFSIVVSNGIAAIADRASTFSHIRWNALCEKNNVRPIFGVELAVVNELIPKKQGISYVTFIAYESVESIYELFNIATKQSWKEPRLTWDQVNDFIASKSGAVLLDDNTRFDSLVPNDDTYYSLHSGSSNAVVRDVIKRGIQLVATSNNLYPRFDDRHAYEILAGRLADRSTYPQHILPEDEWRIRWGHYPVAIDNTYRIANKCHAKLKKARLFAPERKLTLEAMCAEGADRRGIDLGDPVYLARLDRELSIIKEKKYEDYFYIVADLMEFAKANMLCGPARGSSAGSLVCYLLNITDVDPLRFDLLFERFIDINRGGWKYNSREVLENGPFPSSAKIKRCD